MKAIILAGGFGTRLAELTHSIPKPMVPIGGIPILVHIMNFYNHYDIDHFIVAAGYKSEVIKEYFKNNSVKYKVEIIETGLNTMTGGRIKRIKDIINKETFLLTYGDGLIDINIKELINFHQKNKKLATVTAVRPPARFGSLIIENDKVKSFREKSQMDEGWINGGYFVFEPEFIDYIDDDNSILEKKPLETLVKINQLTAFKHEGFWQCMDHFTEIKKLEELFFSNKAPWIKK